MKPEDAIKQSAIEPPTPPVRFRIGDVVVLMSGGPQMTVERVSVTGVLSTVWFANGELRRGTILYPEVLQKLAPVGGR
jgi:uncharacterized protein YodC (DUF2158 family)